MLPLKGKYQHLANKRRWIKVVLISDERHRQWPSIETTSHDYCVCSAEYIVLLHFSFCLTQNKHILHLLQAFHKVKMIIYCEGSSEKARVNALLLDVVPANTTHWTKVGLMLSHRLRRWPNIKPTLVQCVLFTGWDLVLIDVFSLKTNTVIHHLLQASEDENLLRRLLRKCRS